jgi:hypothetical protein
MCLFLAHLYAIAIRQASVVNSGMGRFVIAQAGATVLKLVICTLRLSAITREISVQSNSWFGHQGA